MTDTVFLNGRQIAPTILLDVPRDSLIMKEEIFGPLLPILTVRTKHELLLIVMAMHYALMFEMLTLSVYQSFKLNR